MIIAALAIAAQLANPGFEQGLQGWQTERHRGMGVGIGTNRGFTIRQSAEGEQYVSMGWRARNRAPDDALVRVFQRIDARRYRGRSIRIAARTKAPDFARGFGSMSVRAGGAGASVPIAPSETWRRHAVTLRVPAYARWVEVSFRVERTQAELAVDDVRLVVLR